MPWFIALLLTLSIGFSYSQNPTPREGKIGQEPKARPESSKQPAPADKRGTQHAPLVIEGFPAKDDPNRTKREQDERDHKAFYERWLTIWTGVLAGFTLLLVGVGAWQVFLFRSQLRLMRDAVDDGKKTAEAALESAEMGRVAAQTSRDEFIATHRPRIRVKHLWIESDILGSDEIKISLVVVNHGDTSARHIQGEISTAVVRSDSQLPPKPFFSGEMVFTADVGELPSGITLEFPHLTDHRILSTGDWTSVRMGTAFLYCYGYVDYLDAVGRLRRTTFCRVLRPTVSGAALSAKNARFSRLDIEDEDYEYQD